MKWHRRIKCDVIDFKNVFERRRGRNGIEEENVICLILKFFKKKSLNMIKID